MRFALFALALAGCTPLPAGGGGGIVSVNPCADALLVRLVPPARIGAISHYSQDARASSIPLDVARRFRATAGTAEEVIALRPALVLASTYTPAATRDAYARAGLRTVYLGSPTTVAASVAQVREIAAAVGEPGRGEGIVSAIQLALSPESLSPSELARRRPGPSCDEQRNCVQAPPTETGATGPRLSPGKQAGPTNRAIETKTATPAALLFIAGDLATGSDTLLDELLNRAGFRNAAANYGLQYTGRIPLERLAAQPPAVVIAPGSGDRTAALRRRLLPDIRQADFPRSLINCGGPAIVPALARLRAIRATLR